DAAPGVRGAAPRRHRHRRGARLGGRHGGDPDQRAGAAAEARDRQPVRLGEPAGGPAPHPRPLPGGPAAAGRAAGRAVRARRRRRRLPRPRRGRDRPRCCTALMTSESRYATYPSLRDAVVLISGGASGIGAELVSQFAAQGSRVGFVDVAVEAAEELVAAVAERGHPRPLFRECDIRDLDAYRRVIGEIAAELGDIQVLVNNAGNDTRHRVEDITPSYWDERMRVNLDHQFFAAQTVAPAMRKAGRGSIINMG